MVNCLFYGAVFLGLLADSQNKPTGLRPPQSRDNDFCFLEWRPRGDTVPLLMDMLNLVLEIEQGNIIEFLNIFFEDVSGEVVDVLEYFGLQLLDAFEYLIILFRHIGL